MSVPPEYEPVHHEPRQAWRPGRPPEWGPPEWGPPRPGQGSPHDPRGGAGPRPQPPSHEPYQPSYQPQQPQQPQWPPAPQGQPQGREPYDYGMAGRLLPGFPDAADGYEGDEQDGRYRRDDGGGGRRKRGLVRRLAPLLAALIILAPVVAGGSYVYHLYMSKYHPADYSGQGTGTVQVQVKPGDTAFSLAPELVRLGVVASARAFELAAEHSSNPSGLEPGYYMLREHMRASLAYAALLNPANAIQVTVTIREGLRLTDIIATLVRRDPRISKASYLRALTNPALGLPGYARGKAEGYLFPATYQIQPGATALSVLQQMVRTFQAQAAALNLVSRAAQVHISPAEAVVVASLVQAEGGKVSDFPKIARVIYNRLNSGMKLQLDSTVLYGLGSYGILASDAQLRSDSPYNTYRFAGLPPGPIDSPGAAALDAALHPAAGDWLYFVTVDPKTGLTLFTASVAQFEQYQAELRRNLGQG